MKGEFSLHLERNQESIEGLQDYATALTTLLFEKRTRVQQLAKQIANIQKRVRRCNKLKAVAQKELKAAVAKSREFSWKSEGIAALQAAYQSLEHLLVHSKVQLAHLKFEKESLEDSLAECQSATAVKDKEIVRILEEIDRVKADENKLSQVKTLQGTEKGSFSKRDIKPCSIVQFPYSIGQLSARSTLAMSSTDNRSTASLYSSRFSEV